MIPARADQGKNSRSAVIDGRLHFSGSPNPGQTKQTKSLYGFMHLINKERHIPKEIYGDQEQSSSDHINVK